MRKFKQFIAAGVSLMLLAAPCGVFAEETTEEVTAEQDAAKEDSAIADISSSMVGSWIDDAGTIYTFYDDGSFYNYDAESDSSITGYYVLQTDGENIALTMQLNNEEATIASALVTADTEAGVLTLYNPETGDVLAEMTSYALSYLTGSYMDENGGTFVFYQDGSFYYSTEDGDLLGVESIQTINETSLLVMQISSEESSYMYNLSADDDGLLYLTDLETESELTLTPCELEIAEGGLDYQSVADNLDYAYIGSTDGGSAFCYASNEDGSFAYVLVCDADMQFVSFVGTSESDEETGTVSVTDTTTEYSLTFTVTPSEEGDTLLLDMGDLGSAEVSPSHISNAIYALQDCVNNGTELILGEEE